MAQETSALVTGTSGFLGSALGRHLRASGYRVTGISRHPPRPNATDNYIKHDLAAPLPSDLPRHDVIIHAAALASPWAKPTDYQSNIVEATRHILDYALRTKGDHFVLISTTAVFYILDDQFDITEETPFPHMPINGYAAAKRQAEQLVSSRWDKALIIRPRAIYGPGDTVLFPRILKAASKGLLPQIVRSNDTKARADLVYIGNLVHAIEFAIRKKLSGCINITDACPQDTNTLLGEVLERLGYPLPKFRLSVEKAMRLAYIAEWTSAHFFNWREPPITRFGVSSVAHSKTFDVRRMLELIGPPPFTPEQGIAAFVEWHKAGAIL
jgi:nucleoside-diphosphate-sugar epimerase